MAQRLAVLLLDDGELDDVQAILETVGLPFGRVRGGAIVPNTPPPLRLLVATPRRIDAVRPSDPDLDEGDEPVRVVVVEGDSNTLRAKLREIGFDYLVRRPVHPEALRLLLVHCLYAGDERRREPRVPVGYEISFKAGLLQRRATLADLSSGGCRLLSSYGLHPGKRIKIQIPEDLGATEALTLTGRVLRRDFDPELGESGLYVAAVAFEGVTPDQRHELEWILEERSQGPAVLGQGVAAQSDPRVESPRPRLDESVRPSRRFDPRVEPEPGDERYAVPEPEPFPKPSTAPEPNEGEGGTLGGEHRPWAEPVLPDISEDEVPDGIPVAIRMEVPEPAPEPETHEIDLQPLDEVERQAVALESEEPDPSDDTLSVPPAVVPDGAPGSPEDRRKSRRGTYERKVPAFGSRALRVLVGRNLSRGGMLIERFPELELGDRLHLAIYGDAGEEPFLIWASVARDSGGGGMALVFDEVPPEIGDQLDRLVGGLPAVEALNDGELGAMGTVVSEILES